MKTSLYIILLTLSSFTFADEIPDFKSMKDWGGGLIGESTPQYGYNIYSNQKSKYLVLELLTGYKGNSAIWKHVDYIKLPEYESSYTLAYSLCSKEGKPDSTIAAIVKYEQDKEILAHVKQAWIADLKKEKIKPIPKKNITCINESYGI